MSNKKLEVRAEKPKTTQVKKSLVITVTAVVLILLVLVVVSALQSPKHSQEKVQVKNDFQTAASAVLDQLPSSYSSSDLAKYLPQQKSTIPDAVQQELKNLQSQQASLQAKLAALQKQPQQVSTNSQLTSQAIDSGLFFPGSAPKTTTTTTAATVTSKTSSSTSGSDKQNNYAAQNGQSQKIKFLSSSEKSQIYNLNHLVEPASPYEVQAGSLIPAVLMTAINTSLPGEIVARVRSNVYNSVTGQFLLIPKGSKLIGQYDSQVTYGQRRVLIVFKRIIRPDGSSILIGNSPGSDLFGQAGVEGDVNNHWGRVIGAAVLSTILSMGTGAIADNNFSGDSDYYRSSTQGSVMGAAGNISQVGQQIAGKAMNIQPTLIIPAGYEFNIIVNKDMILSPYHKLANPTAVRIVPLGHAK